MKRTFIILSLAFILQIVWGYLPLPWPDETVFFVSGADLIERSIWHMPFLSYLGESYAKANFNTPPLYSIILYGWTKLFSIYILLGALSAGIVYIAHKLNDKKFIIALFATSPFIFYNAHVSRPEAVIIPLSALLYYILLKRPPGLPYLVSLILALSAYLHYSAIVLVPITMTFLFEKELKKYFACLLIIGLLTAILLSPWLIYLIYHTTDFKIQFFDQTRRMYEAISHSGILRSALIMLFKPATTGLRDNDIFYYLFIVARNLNLLLLLSLIFSAGRRISADAVKSVICFIIAVIFCIKHPEPWFRIYIDLTLLFSILILSKASFTVPAKIFSSLAILANTVLLILVFLFYPQQYFSKSEFNNAVQCLAEELPSGSRVVVNALPDPTVALLLKRPDITVFRMNDFPFHEKEWSDFVAQESNFITARFDIKDFDGLNGIRLDHGDAIKKRLSDAKALDLSLTFECRAENVPIFLHKISSKKLRDNG